MATTQSNAPLAAPYSKKVGRVIFQVSSFADSKGKHTPEQMILSLMERQLMQKLTNQERRRSSNEKT